MCAERAAETEKIEQSRDALLETYLWNNGGWMRIRALVMDGPSTAGGASAASGRVRKSNSVLIVNSGSKIV